MSVLAASEVSVPSPGAEAKSLCFVIDPNLGFCRDFSKQLRGIGVDVIEYSNSARLAESIEDHDPTVVFLNLNPGDPFDCIRALTTLVSSNFTGRVQLIAQCEPNLLKSIAKVGEHLGLTMLMPMQKPVEFSAVRKIVAEQRLGLVSALSREFSLGEALKRGWITFWYQPKIDIRRRQVIGAEAFARLNHPQHGVVSPARFLGGADDDDLQELAKLALIHTLKVSAMFERQGVQLAIGTNISVESLLRLPVADLVRKHRPQGGSWAGLVFDVSERQAVNKIAELKALSGRLKECGISLALDNCGRGNTSIAMLSAIDFAEIKIDAAIVHGCDGQQARAKVCKTIIQMAHNFSSKATAIGVETDAETQLLAALDCDYAQGYLFGKPMNEQKLVAMIMAGRNDSTNFCAPAMHQV